MVVRCSKVCPYLVVCNQLLLKGLVGLQDGRWHASLLCQVVDEGSHHLVKALEDINAGSSDMGVVSSMLLHVELGEVPALLGTSPWDSCEHFWQGPLVYPGAEVPGANSSPDPVDNRCYLQDAISHRVTSILGVFAQEDRPSCGKLLWPVWLVFDATEQKSEGLVGFVGKPG